MELYQLKTFQAVAAEGSLSRAADRVRTSLPAVSAQIKALEEELALRLFDRLPKGMRLTEAGERLLQDVNGVLASADRVSRSAAEIRGEILGCANVATLTDSLPLKIGQIITKLSSRHPQLNVKLQRDVSGKVIQRVRSGELHGGFALAEREPDGVDATSLATIELAVAIPFRYRQEAFELGLDDLREMAWIESVSDCALHGPTHQLFAQMGRTPGPSFVADNESALRSMVASGLGAGILRRQEVEDAVAKHEVAIWPHWRGSVELYWLTASNDQDAIPAALRDVVLEVWM